MSSSDGMVAKSLEANTTLVPSEHYRPGSHPQFEQNNPNMHTVKKKNRCSVTHL